MTQFIKPQNGGGKGGGTGDMLKSVYDPNNVEANAFDYNNFINTPTIPAAQVQADWNEADNTQVDYIKNKPTIPAAQIQSDWDEADNTKLDYIKNKPNLSGYQTTANLVTDLDNADNTHYPSSLAVKNAITSAGGGDVTGPASSTDGDIVLFDGNTGKLIKDGSKALSDLVQTSGNQTIAGTKTFSTSPVVPNKTSTATNTGTAIATEAQVYTVADAVSTINGKISSDASSSNKLVDKNYVDNSINSVTAYYITKNAQGDQFATYAELSAATTFYSGGVARIPTRNDYCIVVADENHDNATTRYIYNSGWEYQYTVNETALTTAQLNALNSGITSGKVSTYDNYASTISGKQDALSTQTAYTSKGTSTKVATISTNTLGQVTAITETSISFPVTSVNGSTGAVSVNDIKVDSTAPSSPAEGMTWYDTANDKLKSYDGSNWNVVGDGDVTGPASSTDSHLAVFDGVTGKLLKDGGSIPTGFSPASAGSTGNVLTKTAGGYDWAAPAASGIVCDPSSPITISKIWCGTESDYSNLGTYDSSCAYLTI